MEAAGLSSESSDEETIDWEALKVAIWLGSVTQPIAQAQ